MICERCGHDNDGEANFCSSCGEALCDADHHTANLPTVGELSALDDHSTRQDTTELIDRSSLSESECALVIRSGPGEGSTFLMKGDRTTIGRHPMSELFLDDITVSRRHAEVIRSENGFVVRDVGSLNGTYLNRERVEESQLKDGDELQIGRFKLVLCCRTNESNHEAK